MKIFDFLFYCLYRMFALVDRVGERNEDLASSFYAVLLSTNTLLLFVLIRYTNARMLFKTFPYNFILKVFAVSIFVIWYIACKRYFIKSKKYERIVEYYERIYSGKNRKLALLGILYTIITFLSFALPSFF